MGKKFTPERLASIRRMRRARRLYKIQPVFAFEVLCAEYTEYTHEQFIEDLRYRTKSKRKKKKNTLIRYGRYNKMMQFLELFRNTGIVEYAMQAQRLRRNMTKPYRVLVKISKKSWEYTVDATVPIQEVEQLTRELSMCNTIEEVEKIFSRFYKNARLR